jgi:DNA polymerase-4
LPLRSVGFRAINLKDDTFGVQRDLFGVSETEEKEEMLENSIDAVRQKFGADSVRRATIINQKELDKKT